MELPKSILNVVKQFSLLPGVGERTALRQCLYMVKWDEEQIRGFSESILNLSTLNRCRSCGMYCDQNICEVCSDEKRQESKTLCIVESISDCMAIENSERFDGIYQVLGGTLNPLMGIGPEELELDKLVERVENLNISEIILALNPSVEGDATCSYLKDIMPQTVKIHRIGFGVPIGGSLEYLDSMTISKALENRKIM